MIKSKATTTVKKDLTKNIQKEIKKAKHSYVTIGVHEDAGSYGDGTSVVQVALWNEFGTKTSPERSFFRSAIDGAQSEINKWREEAVENILMKGWSCQRALEMIGLRMQLLIQNKIKSNVPPPNAPSTLAAKKREGVAPNTLVNTGLMLRSVTYRVFIK